MFNISPDYLEYILKGVGIYTATVLPFSDCSDLITQNRAASRLPSNPTSVLVVLFPYYNESVQEDPSRNVCQYATFPDYHKVITDILTKVATSLSLTEFAVFTDNSPFKEVNLAVRAGLGFRGKNNLLITKYYGSFVFIGELVTSQPLPIGEVSDDDCQFSGTSCGVCTLCQDYCISQCLSSNPIDYSRCVSAITQKKGELSPDEKALLITANSAWGCDCCQNVCPCNSATTQNEIFEFLDDVQPRVTADNLAKLMKTRAFAWRGKAVMKRNLAILEQSW